MRIIKLGIISAIVFFCIITAFSLFIPSHVRISRATNIKNEKDSVLRLIKDSTRWKEWNPAFSSSNNQTVIDSKFITLTDSLVIAELRQGNKKPVINGWQIYSVPQADSLTLQWYMDFHLKWYPWKKFESLFFDNVYGSMMEQGLINMKSKIQ